MQSGPAATARDLDMRALFSETSRWQSWLDVEAALALAEAEHGVIPAAAAAEIAAKCRLDLLDLGRIREGLARTGHGLVPVVWELDRVCAGDAGGYVHWGATTQNITQTGQLLLVRRAHDSFLALIGACLGALARLAEEHKDTLLPGRTIGQHALPVTFGFKAAVWVDELCRHVERLRGCEARVFVVMLGGGAGTLASLGPVGLKVQEGMAARLGMYPMAVPARALGDHLAEYVTLLGLLAATCDKIGREIYLLMSQEFGEVEEPVPPGAVGSSTMPQKRNPRLSQEIMAAAAAVRALVPLALEAMIIDHEGDVAHGQMMTRALTDACTQTHAILRTLAEMLDGLCVFPERMRRNLDLTGGLIMAEAVMLTLANAIGRQHAHDVVYEAAQAAFASGRPFNDLLAEDNAVRSRLTPEQIAELLDPARYTGLSAHFAEQAAVRARTVAASLPV